MVLALHQVPGGSEHAAQLNTAVLFPEGTPGCMLQSQEAACECREAPCQQAAVVEPGAPAQRVDAEEPANGSSTDDAVRGPSGPQQAAAEPTAIEPAATPTGGGEELVQPGPPEQPGASPPSSEQAVPPAAAAEPGQAASAAGAAAPGCAEAQGSTCSSASKQPGSMRPTEPCEQQEQQQLEQQRPAGESAVAGPCALSHAGRPAAPAAGAAAARFPPAAFPGQLLAAWVVDLDRLHPVGEDLGALRDLPGPNSLVLEVEGSLFLHPPPEVGPPRVCCAGGFEAGQEDGRPQGQTAAAHLVLPHPQAPAGANCAASWLGASVCGACCPLHASGCFAIRDIFTCHPPLLPAAGPRALPVRPVLPHQARAVGGGPAGALQPCRLCPTPLCQPAHVQAAAQHAQPPGRRGEQSGSRVGFRVRSGLRWASRRAGAGVVNPLCWDGDAVRQYQCARCTCLTTAAGKHKDAI